MTTKEMKFSVYVFSFVSLCLCIFSLVICYICLDETNNQVRYLIEEHSKQIELVYNLNQNVEEYKKQTEDYKLFADTIVQKVVNNEW